MLFVSFKPKLQFIKSKHYGKHHLVTKIADCCCEGCDMIKCYMCLNLHSKFCPGKWCTN